MTSTKTDIVNAIAAATRDGRLEWEVTWCVNNETTDYAVYEYKYRRCFIRSHDDSTSLNGGVVAVGDNHLSLRKTIEVSFMEGQATQNVADAIKLLPPTANEMWESFPKKWKDIGTTTGVINNVGMLREVCPLIEFDEEDEDQVLEAADVVEIRHLEKITLSYTGEIVAVMRRDSMLPSIWKWNTFGKPQIMANIRETIKKHG